MWPEVAILRKRLTLPIVTLVVTLVLGTLGYWLLWRGEGGTFSDALFMTFTMVTTIGFGEIHPLGEAGRVLTMAVAAGGIGSLFYSFTVALDWATSDGIRTIRRKRKMQREIDALSGHYLLAGFGRVGREAAGELKASGGRVVVIDPADENITAALDAGCLAIKGDATDDVVLRSAGIERAKGIVVTTSNDATNLYVVMSARLLSPALFIISRAVDNNAVPKLERAGANRAISPYAIGGRRMAHLMMSPRVIDFFETALHRGSKSLAIGEIQIGEGTQAAGKSLESLDVLGSTAATVLAVLQHADGTIITPRRDTILRTGDHVLALGTDEQLQKLEEMLST